MLHFEPNSRIQHNKTVRVHFAMTTIKALVPKIRRIPRTKCTLRYILESNFAAFNR